MPAGTLLGGSFAAAFDFVGVWELVFDGRGGVAVVEGCAAETDGAAGRPSGWGVVAVVGCAVARAVEDWEKARVVDEMTLRRARRLRQRWQIMLVVFANRGRRQSLASLMLRSSTARSRGNAKTFETITI